MAEHPSRLTRSGWVLLLAIAATASGVRVWQVDESLWLDELHTAWVIANGAGNIQPRAAIGNQSPLYFWIIAATTRCLGDTEWVIRLPSVIAGVTLVLVAFEIIRRWTNSLLAAGVVSILMTLDHHCIFYSQEARPYACVQLAGLLHLIQFWSLQRTPTVARRASAVATGIGMFWLHYTSGLLFAAEASWYFMLVVRGKTSYRPGSALSDAICLVIGVLPAAPHLIEIGGRREGWSAFVKRDAIWIAGSWFSLVSYVAAPASFWCITTFARVTGARKPSHSMPDNRLWSLVFLWFAIPLVLAWLLTWFDLTRLFFPRYLVACIAAPMVFAGLALASISDRRLRTAAAIVVVVFAAARSEPLRQFQIDGRFLTDRKQDWSGAIGWLNERAIEPQELIFVRSGLIEADSRNDRTSTLLDAYCLLPVTGLYRLRNSDQQLIPLPTSNPAQLTKAVAGQLAASERAWLILNGKLSSQSRSLAELLQAADEHGIGLSVAHRQSFGEVLVVRVAVRR